MKILITGLLSKAYNLDKGKIAELIKDGMSEDEEKEALNKILEINASHISTVQENAVKNVDKAELIKQGYNKANAEIMTKFEDGLKNKFGVKSDKTGQELVDLIVAEQAEKAGSGEVTEDTIRRSKIYLDLESKAKKDVETLTSDFEKQINEIKSSHDYEKTFSNVQQKALQVFNGLNPVLPEEELVKTNQVNNFINSLKNDYKFEEQGDRTVVLDKDGKVLLDPHGNSRSFEDVVKERASGLFVFKVNNGGSGAGNGNGNGGSGGGSGSLVIPKTFEDLEKIMNDESISKDDRVNIIAEFEKAQKGVE